jgi:hypothetical protein
VLTISIGVGVAWIFGNPASSIWEDIKPLLYFLMLPFFAFAIEESEVKKISRLVKVCSVIMAVVFLLTLIFLNTGLIPFLSFYNFSLPTQEFFYRGELSFFYKGFLFFGIGSIFYYFSDSRLKYFFISFLILSIVASVTRGLLFSLAITYAIYYFRNKSKVQSVIAVVIAAFIVVWGNGLTIAFSRWLDSNNNPESIETLSPNLFGNRNYSDVGRYQQIQEVKEETTFSSFLVGHGFGQGIPSRSVHMEISYLEIFHKQGIIGLAFWTFLLISIIRKYQEAQPCFLAEAYFYSSLFVFIQSLTNQYINNPIGIAMLLLSFSSLDKLRKQ